jgi:hypothetical protein
LAHDGAGSRDLGGDFPFFGSKDERLMPRGKNTIGKNGENDFFPLQTVQKALTTVKN